MTKLYNKTNNNYILAVSGFTRSAKAMLMNLISTMKYVEKSNTDVLLEQAYYLHKIKKINFETAKYILEKNLNIIHYYNSIGRNVNYKINDFSSVYKYHNPSLYLKRSKSKLENLKLNSNKYLFQIMLHSGLNSANLILKSYKNLKIIEIMKNPLEIVYSWIKKNYGKDIYDKSNVYVLTIEYRNKILPYYARGWEKKYLRMSEYDRCASMIMQLYRDRENQIKKLSKSELKKVLFIGFDNLITNPKIEIFEI